MGNCKACKFFSSTTEAHDGIVKDITVCSRIITVNYDDLLDEDDADVFASPGPDGRVNAGLKVGPLFGCVKFERKV